MAEPSASNNSSALNLSGLFSSIANAIRDKDGTTESITASDFPERISAIQAGGEGLATAEFVFTSDANSDNFVSDFGEYDYGKTRVDLEAQYYDVDLQQYQTIRGTSMRKYRTTMGSVIRVGSNGVVASDGSGVPNRSTEETSGVTPIPTGDTSAYSYYLVAGQNAVLRYPSAQDIEGAAATVASLMDVANLGAEQAAILVSTAEMISAASSTEEFVESAGIADTVYEVLDAINLFAEEPLTIDDLHASAPVMVLPSPDLIDVVERGGSIEISIGLSVLGLSGDMSATIAVCFDGSNFVVFPSTVLDGRLFVTIYNFPCDEFALFVLSASTG